MRKLWFMFAMMVCILASCSDGGNEDPVNSTPKPEEVKTEITIDSGIISNGLSFGVGEGEQSVSFSVNADWTLSIAETRSGTEWCTASPTSGGKGTATVKFKTTENIEPEDRSVAVTIKAGTASKTFTITQKGADALLVTTDKYEVAQEGGQIEIEVKANIDYQMEISETAKGWITEASSRTLTAHKHTLDIAMNEDAEKREGEIIFKSGDKVETVKVYQTGGAILLLSQNEYTVSDAGETISVDVKSNVEYGVQMPDVNWIKDEASNRGMSSHTLKYIVSANETYDSRSAEIIFYDKNSNLKDTLTVIQAQKDAIIISEKNFSVNREGGTIEVKVNTNVNFEVQIPSDVTWVSQTDSRTLSEKSIYLKIAENTSEGQRNANITITNKNTQLSETITITQQGNISVVTLKEAGTMKELLGDDYLNITSLKVVGPINGDDVYCLRKMLGGSNFIEDNEAVGELTTLDLSEATVVKGGEWYLQDPYFKQYYYTRNNEISEYMFYKCTNLKNIIPPSSVTSVGLSAFYGCDALTAIKIPDSVISIDDDAFMYCSALATIEIGNGVTSIGRFAFSLCYTLTTIKIPDSVISIGSSAFSRCASLTAIKIPDSVITIDDCAFEYCSALTTVEIGNGVTSIGSHVFYSCDALTTIKIPDSVTSIDDGAFMYCWALTTVEIGNGLTSIAMDTFCCCYALTSVEIGNGVTTISGSAFQGCKALTTVKIGNSLTLIGGCAFRDCSIKTCYCYASTPPTIVESYDIKNFFGVEKGATLYVPESCSSLYESSSWGNYFTNIVEIK